MSAFIDLFIIGSLLISFVYAYKKYRLIILHSKRKKSELVTLILIGLSFFYMGYKSKLGFRGYLIVSIMLIYIVVYTRIEGLGEEGIVVSLGRGLNNIKLIKYEDFRIVKLKIRDDIKLEAQGSKALAVMYFKKEDLSKVESLIQGVRLKKY